MLNVVWAIIIIASVFYMLITGNAAQIIITVTDSASNAVQICLSLVGIYCFWLGIMNIAKEAELMDKLSNKVSPVLGKLFPGTGKTALGHISMNIAANMLGLGDAATPFGLAAMDALKKESPLCDVASDSMILFLILNTASLQLIPTTVISLRASMGATSPASIVIPTLITTFVSATFGVIFCKTFERH